MVELVRRTGDEMRIEINLEKRHFFVLFFIVLVFGGFLIVMAYNPGGIGGIPSKMGHSVDEIDWGKPIQETVTLVKDGTNLGAPTLQLVGNTPTIRIDNLYVGRIPISSYFLQLISNSLVIGKASTGGSIESNLVFRDGRIGIGKVPDDISSKLNVDGNVRFGQGNGVKLAHKITSLGCNAIGSDLLLLFKKCNDGKWHLGSDNTCFSNTEIVCVG